MKSGLKKNITRSLANGREDSLSIPIELIITIFSKLDLKSIARCRCVSKFWGNILRRSDFTELFMSMSSSRAPQLLLAFGKESKMFFSSPHPQNAAVNLSRVVINYQMKFPFDPLSYFKNSDLVNGLICLTNLGVKNEPMMICNPSTGQTLMLPDVKTGSYCVWSLFGYDPIDKQFKVLAVTRSEGHALMCDEFQVLTLGSGNMSWRMIECGMSHIPPRKKICINGGLYYKLIGLDASTCKIVCFDIRFEKFTFIKLVGTLKEVVFRETVDLINYNGKLGLLQWYGDNLRFGFFGGISIRFKLWVLEDLEKQDWSEHRFLFSDVPKNIVMDKATVLGFAGVTKKKEIVMRSYYPSNPLYLFYLNLETKTIKRVEIQGIDVDEDHGVDHIFIDHVENVKFY